MRLVRTEPVLVLGVMRNSRLVLNMEGKDSNGAVALEKWYRNRSGWRVVQRAPKKFRRDENVQNCSRRFSY
jgi:hypothetical protein